MNSKFPNLSDFSSLSVMVFIYLLFKTGVFGCLGGAMGKMLRAFCSSSASACEKGFHSLRRTVRRIKKARVMAREEELEIEEEEDEEYRVGFFSGAGERSRRRQARWESPPSSSSSWSARSRERRRSHLERSLRARSHRIRVELTERHGREPRHGRRYERTLHDVRVTRASKFVRKPSASRLRRRRWY